MNVGDIVVLTTEDDGDVDYYYSEDEEKSGKCIVEMVKHGWRPESGDIGVIKAHVSGKYWMVEYRKSGTRDGNHTEDREEIICLGFHENSLFPPGKGIPENSYEAGKRVKGSIRVGKTWIRAVDNPVAKKKEK